MVCYNKYPISVNAGVWPPRQGRPPVKPEGNVVLHVRAALADWGVQIGDEEECLEVARRLRVLMELLQLLMEQYPDDPRALVPPGFPPPGAK